MLKNFLNQESKELTPPVQNRRKIFDNLFLLSGENAKLAKAEVLALVKCDRTQGFGGSGGTCFFSPHLVRGEKSTLEKGAKAEKINISNNEDRVLILKSKENIKDLITRLAYTKRIFKLLFSCKKKELIKKFENYPWEKIYQKNFSIRIINLTDGTTESEKFLAKFVWNSVDKPKVNLENPKTPITVILTKNYAHVCLFLQESKENFEKRRAHLRPGLLPISMHPKLARAVVNLTGIRKGEILYDTFCGTGGILIEAGLIGCKTIGYDIYDKALKCAKENLDYFKIKKYRLMKKNALKIKNKINYLATDLPYGKGAKAEKNLENFYLKFLKNLRKILRKKAVIIFPDNVNYKKLIKKAKLKIIGEFDYYIHKSMTKKIVVFGAT